MGKTTPSRHHRKARSFGGSDNGENISLVPQNKHRAWHLLFDCGAPETVAERINKTWIDPEYVVVAIKKKDIERLLENLYDVPIVASSLKKMLKLK